MTEFERNMILEFMEKNKIDGYHNFLICHSGPNPILKFILGFPWNPMYETLISRACVLIFTDQYIVIYTMPILTNFSELPKISLEDRRTRLIPRKDVHDIIVGKDLQDTYIKLYSVGFARYYYLYIDELVPSVQEYNFWNLLDTDFMGLRR